MIKIIYMILLMSATAYSYNMKLETAHIDRIPASDSTTLEMEDEEIASDAKHQKDFVPN